MTSVHKMGGAVEQSSCFHLRGDRIDPAVLKAREDLLGTTSSSALVYLTLDGWRRHMVEQGDALLSAPLERAGRTRYAIQGLDGLTLMGREVVRPQRVRPGPAGHDDRRPWAGHHRLPGGGSAAGTLPGRRRVHGRLQDQPA